jgi:hypothetical protein
MGRGQGRYRIGTGGIFLSLLGFEFMLFAALEGINRHQAIFSVLGIQEPETRIQKKK